MDWIQCYHKPGVEGGITGLLTTDGPHPPDMLTFTLPEDVAGDLLFDRITLDEALEYAQHLNPAAVRYLAQRHIGVR